MLCLIPPMCHCVKQECGYVCEKWKKRKLGGIMCVLHLRAKQAFLNLKTCYSARTHHEYHIANMIFWASLGCKMIEKYCNIWAHYSFCLLNSEGYFFYDNNFYEDRSNETLVLEFFLRRFFLLGFRRKKLAIFFELFSPNFFFKRIFLF